MSAPLLLSLLRDPGAAFTLPEWDLLLRQAGSANMVARLYALLEQCGALERVPAQARAHLQWAHVAAQRHRQAVRWEVGKIAEALADVGAPTILLKGAAYAIADLPPAAGRLFSDIDILVPKAVLDETESMLMVHGWVATHLDAYDQRYYRDWMHELPPMEHQIRGTSIDVHHAILPETAKARPDPALLRAGAVAIPGRPGLYTLAPTDIVLHSATHLMYEGEFDHGLRDLGDIHSLLLHYGADAAFWPALTARAAELQLGRPLFYALRYAARLLHTPVPAHAFDALHAARPPAALLTLMDWLFARALLPKHPSCTTAGSGAARFMLYLRGNWLRMPPLLLARHLFHKAFFSPKKTDDAPAQQ